MIRKATLALSVAAIAMVPALSAHAQDRQAPAPVLTTPEAQDAWTYAEPAEARVSHVSLDLVTDFDNRRIYGTATLDITAGDDADTLVLDDAGLQIGTVTDGEGNPLSYELGAAKNVDAMGEALGRPLTIAIGDARQVRIDYVSAPDASALQWLPPEATAGGEKPFLFSQGQPISNRSWIPTQDSPGIRQSWDARITVPEGLVPVMSGVRQAGDMHEWGNGWTSYGFVMDNPVPPYLIALAVGDLTHRDLGPRSGVWAEPSMVDAAAEEFGDVEAMIDAAEDLYGPYRWGRYDMLLLPPSFPYGGMENPVMTFLTPTLLTGDRSNTDVVAHELAHSWSGNLVTNASWRDSWLNEGFTTYFENRIMESLYGAERAAMYADLDWGAMIADIDDAGGMDAPSTRLHGEPGETAGQLDYFKGSTFLRTVEKAVGRDRFDAWLRSYFDRFAFQPQTSAGLIADMRANLLTDAEFAAIGVEDWIYGPGLPGNAVHPESETLKAVDAQLAAFNAGGPASAVDTEGWATQQWLRFLRGIDRTQDAARLAELDNALTLSNSGNAYVQSAWFELAIANRYEPAVPAMRAFLDNVGRMLLIRPIYAGLVEQGDWGMEIARSAFAQSRSGYHPIAANMVEGILASE
ncbi:M1 family metallopeptidase [Croceicoccus sp. YJ47]|uniref:M1 family metallopeptidase n=1 Tax=Croceicoccus sp. YJ47 TaxID=2798724 RepID=UPI001920F295|nr:M1 family metallopeptidase [Croceicoccus sp. YJ47]QQN73040.1 M1 family metallopeptidase [Croceicoccus sp. YJ47]